MKTIIKILFLFLLISLPSFSQGYKSYFGEEFTRWYINNCAYDWCQSNTIEINNKELYLINGKEYKKAVNDWGQDHYYLREDTIT
ncbi:hypothetical protein AwDysgo_09960 [Bacteroidales bacterium]|nr:hypothetical protein AwDysgo_09960 [Bacteroidales bacterium]